ncbi:MAG: hypothetical protein ACKO47_05960, partial [Alphaproteobacteria bacterium]
NDGFLGRAYSNEVFFSRAYSNDGFLGRAYSNDGFLGRAYSNDGFFSFINIKHHFLKILISKKREHCFSTRKEINFPASVRQKYSILL